jgi:hypothetical protein
MDGEKVAVWEVLIPTRQKLMVVAEADHEMQC